MKYSPEVYAGALIALAALRDKATEREIGTIDFIAEAIAEKGDRDKLLSAPAADVAPVVHGRWNIIQDTLAVDGAGRPLKHMECSRCKQYWSEPRHAKCFKRCFNCGALMDGKDEDNG